jgi:hypothetical protein
MSAIDPRRPLPLNLAQTPEDFHLAHERHIRAQRATAPAWAFDRPYVNILAQDLVLPRLCAELGLGPAVTTCERPAWWPFPAPRPGPAGVILVLRARHYGLHATCLIDQSTWEWALNGPPVIRSGRDLVELAAFIWGGSEAKAAWRIVRMAGRSIPWPA